MAERRRSKTTDLSSSSIPDLQGLTTGLTALFAGSDMPDGEVTVLQRHPNVHASTFPTEIVKCVLPDGVTVRLFCKYGCVSGEHEAHGHRGGIAHEDRVYRHVLRPLGISTPGFFGTYTDSTANQRWLILAYVDARVRASATGRTMRMASRWIGQFHAASRAHLSDAPTSFLKAYDREYYVGWARRTSLFGSALRRDFPWLGPLCARCEEWVDALLLAPQTIIHGEYYPGNVFVKKGAIVAVDWESAAVAAGEIDLAALTERTPRSRAQTCEQEYALARWLGEVPPTFEQTLAAARLYLHFRWLGDRRDRTTHPSWRWRFDELRQVAKRLGLI